jgi:hypothetical protein
MIENHTRTLPGLSNDDLALVVGGAIIIVEDGKEQYPADIGSLSKSRMTKKKARKRRRR